MKKPSMPAPVQMPYASTAASFFSDQGAAIGNSFLGRVFGSGGGRMTVVQGNPTTKAPVGTSKLSGLANMTYNNRADR